MTKRTHAKYIVVIAILGATIVWLATKRHHELFQDDQFGVKTASIVVLPFLDNGPVDPSSNLAATITSDLIDELSESPQLSVLPASAWAEFEGRRLSIQEIGELLGATHVIEGGVQETLGQLRISIQVIDARTDGHVWAEIYQVDADDISSFTASAEATISSKLR